MFTQPKATGEGPPSPVPLTWKSAPQAPARAVRMRPVTAPPVSSCAWRWTDLVLATALAIAAVLVIAPAIQYSRNEARLVGCQDNLRDLGTRMAVFGQSRPEFAPAPVRLDSTVPVRFIAAPVAVPLNVAVPVNAVDPFAKRGLPPRAGGPFPSAPIPGQQGVGPAVVGQNLLLPDGRVIFFAAQAPESDESPDPRADGSPLLSPISWVGFDQP